MPCHQRCHFLQMTENKQNATAYTMEKLLCSHEITWQNYGKRIKLPISHRNNQLL
jgi:hypothetical protein